MKKLMLAATAALAFVATSAGAATVSNPGNTYNYGPLSGSLTGGNQVQYIGQSFTAPVTGTLTNFQFTLNQSNLTSLYAVVYTWNGSTPGTQLWQSGNIAATTGLLNFNPTGVELTEGQNYVAFLSTYGVSGNSGLAYLGDCLSFAGCGSNSIPNLGDLVQGRVEGAGLDEVVFSKLNYHDLTFSATVTPAAAAVPESATWAMMIAGFGLVGGAMRRRTSVAFA
jgi:hypothetical protein